MPNYRGCPRRGEMPVPTAQWKRRWSPREVERLKELVTTVSYTAAAKRLRRTEASLFRMIDLLGGLRQIALQARLIGAGALRKLLRMKSDAALGYWRSIGLPCRLLGGFSWGVGRGATQRTENRVCGSYFYRLADVVAFIQSRPRLIVTLDPDARRLLKIEMPAAGPKPPPPSQTAEGRRARRAPVPLIPCDICGHKLFTTTKYRVCTTNAACRHERQRRIWTAIKQRSVRCNPRKSIHPSSTSASPATTSPAPTTSGAATAGPRRSPRPCA